MSQAGWRIERLQENFPVIKKSSPTLIFTFQHFLVTGAVNNRGQTTVL